MALPNTGVDTFCCCLICSIPERHVLVESRFGKFNRFLRPGSGIRCYNCCFGQLEGLVALKQLSLSEMLGKGSGGLVIDAKTSDDTFMRITMNVLFRVKEDDQSIYSAYYNLDAPYRQIQAYVEDVVRTAVTKETMIQVYSSKDNIASQVKGTLSEELGKFGYEIVDCPVTDVQPASEGVSRAMNKKQEEQRNYESEVNKAETKKMVVEKRAEAMKQAQELAGEGISLQRMAIVNGLRESVASFSKGVKGVSSRDVLELILVTQYFDMMKDISVNGGNTMFVQHNPSAVAQISEEIRQGFSSAKKG